MIWYLPKSWLEYIIMLLVACGLTCVNLLPFILHKGGRREANWLYSEGAELATGRGTGLTTELGVALTNLPSEHHRSQAARCDYGIRKFHSSIPNTLTGALGSMGEADAGEVTTA